jgi:hypothetical protein
MVGETAKKTRNVQEMSMIDPSKNQSSILDDNTIYSTLRSEIRMRFDRVSKTHSWSVLLAGASAGVCLQSLRDRPILNNPIGDAFNLCFLVLCCVIILNFSFFLMAWKDYRMITQIGAFLTTVERRADLSIGWEQWIFLRQHNRNGTDWLKIITDINFVLHCVYLASSIILVFLRDSDCISATNRFSPLAVAICITLLAIPPSLDLANSRSRALREISRFHRNGDGGQQLQEMYDLVRAKTDKMADGEV